MDFSWLSDIFNGILQFIPRPVIVRATHGGVCWVFGSKIKELKPGWRWVWPLIMDWDIIPVARQTTTLNNQGLITKDKQKVQVSGIVVFSINDIIQAIGQRNYDADTTIDDIASAAIAKVVTNWNFNDLLNELTKKVEKELTETCQRQLRQVGVRVHRCCFTDFSDCRIHKIMGLTPVQSSE